MRLRPNLLEGNSSEDLEAIQLTAEELRSSRHVMEARIFTPGPESARMQPPGGLALQEYVSRLGS